MRRHLASDFTSIVHINLKGDARTSGQRRQQEGGNVFEDAIRVGVGITFFIRGRESTKAADIRLFEAADYASATEKQLLPESASSVFDLPLSKATITSDGRYWTQKAVLDHGEILIASRETKALRQEASGVIFKNYGRGIATCRDVWAYNSSLEMLLSNISEIIETFNSELARWIRANCPVSIDGFLIDDSCRISWSEGLKLQLRRKKQLRLDKSHFRVALYRPFDLRQVYFDPGLVERRYQMPVIFPNKSAESENRIIVINDIAYRSPYSCLMSKIIVDLHVCSSDAFQCFPFFIYDEDGSNRRENITDWALNEYRTHYNDQNITKWDIFYYVYALLHHPDYRERYAAHLKRELPRIPYAPDFWDFAKAGKRLADLHVNYEEQPDFPLERIENPNEKISYRVEKMRLGKDKSAVIYNSFLTLSGIPAEVYEYRLGNRSALEWVIDQYQVSTDKRSGITNDPNREDDEQYISAVDRASRACEPGNGEGRESPTAAWS